MLSVSSDANGWTVVTPPHDARVIYVSSSTGHDDNSGLSPSTPVQSIDHAKSLLRDRSADQMLLRRGDVWQGGLGVWRVSGRSAQEPMVVGAYGSGARPLLETGGSGGVVIGMTSSPRVDHVDFLGLHFYADSRDPASPTFAGSPGSTGIYIVSKSDGLWIEDCDVQGYGTDISIDPYFGHAQNVTLRRSVILDAYSATSAHSEGFFADGVNGLQLLENVFDHNGWNAAVPAAVATIYNHDCYLTSTNTGVVVHGNVFADASSHGLQARSGGDVQDNVFIDDPIGMSFGLVRGATITPGGVSGVVNGNVILGDRDINGAGRGWGLEVGNTAPAGPTVVSNNIFSHDAQNQFPAIMLQYGSGDSNGDAAVGINDLTIEGNVVYRWAGGLSVESGMQPGATGPKALNGLRVSGNDFQQITQSAIVQDGVSGTAGEDWSDNRYDGAGPNSSWIVQASRTVAWRKWVKQEPGAQDVQPAYLDAERTADTYAQTLGAGALSFVDGARLQSSQAWDPRYTAAALIGYVRDGFNETTAGVPPRNWLPPTPPTENASVPDTVTTAAAALTFTVTYTDDKAVDVSSIASGNVRLVRSHGPGGLAATLLNVSGGGGAPVVATYSVAAPHTVWRHGDQGRYQLVLGGTQVKDTEGFYSPGGVLAAIKLHVLQAPKPPTVRRVSFRPRHPQAIAVRFSEDVSSTLTVSDLVLTAGDGSIVDPSLMAMTLDVKHNTATWAFPGLANGDLPAGAYHITLRAATLTDAGGRQLDGNRDGLGGDDFVSPRTYKSRG